MATHDTNDAYPNLPTEGLTISSQNIDHIDPLKIARVYGQNKTYFQTALVWTHVFWRLVPKWTYDTSGFVW